MRLWSVSLMPKDVDHFSCIYWQFVLLHLKWWSQLFANLLNILFEFCYVILWIIFIFCILNSVLWITSKDFMPFCVFLPLKFCSFTVQLFHCLWLPLVTSWYYVYSFLSPDLQKFLTYAYIFTITIGLNFLISFKFDILAECGCSLWCYIWLSIVKLRLNIRK